MEMFTGRLTADAKLNTTKNDKQVVNFSVAINDYYKPKNGEAVKAVTFINCSYWLSTKIAERLGKGAVVEIGGRLHVSAYMTGNNEAKASLNCHVQYIKIHHSTRKPAETTPQPAGEEVTDDLPF